MSGNDIRRVCRRDLVERGYDPDAHHPIEIGERDFLELEIHSATADAITVTLNRSSRASIAVWATQPSVLIPASRIRSIPRSSRTSASGVWSNAEYLGFESFQARGQLP